MTSVRRALLAIIASSPACAAAPTIQLTTPPPLRDSIAAMPQIAAPTNDSERRINAALQALDANLEKAVAACKGGDWQRSVETPMAGAGYLSLVITDSYACDDAAHPDTATSAIVYDLSTGRPVNWSRLLPPGLTGEQTLVEAGGSRMVALSSKHLFQLYMDGYTDGGATGQDLADCKEALRAGGDTPPPANVWLDAKRHGLAVEIELPHAVAACEDFVVIPVEELKREGASAALVKALMQ
jgi:hypothetical protein